MGHAMPTVWTVYDPLIAAAASGLLVTEPGDLDRPVAFIDTAASRTVDARRLARRVVADPGVLDDAAELAPFREHVLFVDLRRCGRWDSPEPLPAWVYGLRCRVAGDRTGKLQSPRPPCRFFLAEMFRPGRPGRGSRRA